MKKNFTTGLAILLPIMITFILVKVIVDLMSAPFNWIITNFFNSLNIAHPSELVVFISEILMLATLFGITYLFGALAKNYISSPILRSADRILVKIPLISQLYRAFKEIFYALFHETSTSFSHAVLVPFPTDCAHALGLVMRKDFPEADKINEESLSVFVPGTPNPTMGYMLNYKPEDVVFLDMEVSKAFKFILSCGVIYEK